MTARRRSRRRPLAKFAQRSRLHAVVAGLLRVALLLAVSVIAYVVIMNVLVPNMIDGLVEQFQNRNR